MTTDRMTRHALISSSCPFSPQSFVTVIKVHDIVLGRSVVTYTDRQKDCLFLQCQGFPPYVARHKFIVFVTHAEETSTFLLPQLLV
jgi:hypothetical protein